MGRDYAARNRRPAARPAGLPGWVWLVAGLSLGLIVAVIVYIGRPTQPMPMAPAAGAAAQAAAMAKPRAKVEIPPKEEPRFGFYTLLPEEQVVVAPGGPDPRSRLPAGTQPPPLPQTAPAAPAVTAPKPPPPAAVTATAAGAAERYMVVAGAFRDRSNAEQHRANLALAGIETRIEDIRGKDNGTLYRVRSAPENNLATAQALLSKLKSSGFEGNVVRMP